tara:strand:+ start:6881 stop:8308 length:1428 start_codon:yes stop_codon:yes gene_type:complete
MPSGELLAPSLFTESGIQSVRSTNEVDNSENVVSKFLSQPARNYISGSEVGTIEQVVKLSDTNAAAAAIFTLPSNCDVITGVSLTVLNTAKNTTNSSATGYKDTGSDGYGVESGVEIFNMITSIEVRIGNTVFQTLKGADLLSRIITEDGHKKFKSFLKKSTTTGTGSSSTTTINNYAATYNINTKIFSGSGGYINSFLQCGAPSQNMSIKVNFNSAASHGILKNDSGYGNQGILARLEYTKHSLTQTERNYIRDNLINSVVNSSESIGPYYIVEGAATASNSMPSDHIDLSDFKSFSTVDDRSGFKLDKYTISLNEFKLNCSHLLITICPRNALDSSLPEAFKQEFEIVEAQLKISGANHGGVYSSSFMKESAITFLGLDPGYANENGGEIIYAIPIGSYKFGSDSVPLSKVRSVQLELSIHQYIQRANSADSSSNPPTIAYTDTTTRQGTDLYITAVGTNVLTYTGGSVNIHF